MKQQLVGIMAVVAVLLALAGCDDSRDPVIDPDSRDPAISPSDRDRALVDCDDSDPPDPDCIKTKEYVTDAIAYYEANGRDATVKYYNNPQSIEGERYMVILQGDDDQVVLAFAAAPLVVGTNLHTGPNTPSGSQFAQATEEGRWSKGIGLNPATRQAEPSLRLAVRHDGLIFSSAHFIVHENVAAATQGYVQRATDFYDRVGLDATIAYYDSRDSLEGQFYLFLIGADDLYLAHPIFPHLKGTDIKDVMASDNPELGMQIAAATEDGDWVYYLWPHPVTGIEEPKSAWVVRHDGLIFASGYYTPGPDSETPAWVSVAPDEYADYTVEYVNRAIDLYKRHGLEAMQDYYNSVVAFEGQWYLFAMDAADIYIVHPFFPHLRGTDIKDLRGRGAEEDRELGRDIVEAADAADPADHWVEYLWPHPATLQVADKVAYVVRHDGYIFASGYYPEPDHEADTKQYVRDAIDYYEANGLDATIAYYNTRESIEGQWFLALYRDDENRTVLTQPFLPNVIGQSAFPAAIRTIQVSEAGTWFEYQFTGAWTPEFDQANAWLVLHDGLIFSSAYFSRR